MIDGATGNRGLRYWGAAGRALARQLRDKDFARTWLSFGLISDRLPRARTTHLLLAYPELARASVPMGDVTLRLYNLDPTEQYLLAALAMLRAPRRIFEFGTFDGSTTLLLARCAPGAEVVTLDLPPDQRADPDDDEQHDMAGGTGARFEGQPEAARITQLLGDSRRFDATPYAGTMDLVLVDGGHDYECVRADSGNAFTMLAPGGIVVWDDYMAHYPEVIAAVDDATAAHGIQVVHLEPTDFVVYDPALSGSIGTPMRGWGA